MTSTREWGSWSRDSRAPFRLCSSPARELHPGQHEEGNGRDAAERGAEPDGRDDRDRHEPPEPDSGADAETDRRGSPGRRPRPLPEVSPPRTKDGRKGGGF